MNRRRGHTLVELMMTVAVIGIISAMAIPVFQSDVASSLNATADVVIADLMQARQYAIANNSQYRLTFEVPNNRYYLEYSGANSALATLPTSIYRDPANTATRQYFDLDDVPHLGATVYLNSVLTAASSPTTLTTVEFGPLGATTQAADTVIWLVAGDGDSLRYTNVRVSAVTGLVQQGEIDAAGPQATGS
jgi:prepilin-type N-terminal cleavage/methylation domain-containing protein